MVCKTGYGERFHKGKLQTKSQTFLMTLPSLWFVFFCSFIIPNKNLRSFSQRQINNGATISLTKLQLKQRLFMSKSQEWNNKK